MRECAACGTPTRYADENDRVWCSLRCLQRLEWLELDAQAGRLRAERDQARAALSELLGEIDARDLRPVMEPKRWRRAVARARAATQPLDQPREQETPR